MHGGAAAGGTAADEQAEDSNRRSNPKYVDVMSNNNAHIHKGIYHKDNSWPGPLKMRRSTNGNDEEERHIR